VISVGVVLPYQVAEPLHLQRDIGSVDQTGICVVSVLHDLELERLLVRLHARSDVQRAAISGYSATGDGQGAAPVDAAARVKQFRSDKLVALDRDKAEFCYQLCRAIDARRIVEIGTSYGVSTLYLAAALRDNIRARGGGGLVIGTEYEPEKAKAAREHFAQAGISDLIDLREGDLRQTLRDIEGPVDFVLIDVWISMARPALDLVAPHLRPGAIVVCDNTGQSRADYAEYLAFINDPSNGFRTMTLPFDGGFEFSVRCLP
jgi:predicted O-methyltransferase YrrM